MFSFVRRRMYTSALPLIIVLLGVFLLARLTGDPTNLYLPESATPEQREAFATANGLNDPLITQLADYFKGVVHLDFGTSLRTGESASEMALRAFPATLQLAFATMLLAVIGAVVIGCWAAYRPNSFADRFSSLLSMTAASIPDFWFAITGVWLFAVLLGVLPTSGVDAGILSWVLPIATLMIRPLGVLTQVVRGAMVSLCRRPTCDWPGARAPATSASSPTTRCATPRRPRSPSPVTWPSASSTARWWSRRSSAGPASAS